MGLKSSLSFLKINLHGFPNCWQSVFQMEVIYQQFTAGCFGQKYFHINSPSKKTNKQKPGSLFLKAERGGAQITQTNKAQVNADLQEMR